jgi:hypothetical protein
MDDHGLILIEAKATDLTAITVVLCHALSDRAFFSVFHSFDYCVLIPHTFPDCITDGDMAAGGGCGQAFLCRQGTDIHSTDPLCQVRRQCAFDPALSGSGQTRRLRGPRFRMLRMRTPNTPQRESLDYDPIKLNRIMV